MQGGLTIKFNHKAPKEVKEIKSEADLKTGVRGDGAGGKFHVRGGKIVGHTKSPAEKLNEYRHAASEAAAKQAKASQEHHKPAHVKPSSPPSL